MRRYRFFIVARARSYILLATFILPLVTIGVWKLRHSPRGEAHHQ